MELNDLKIKTLGIDIEKFGRIFSFKDLADLYINAQIIKLEITRIKETTPQ
ncbi:MAG: hypothetical protein AAB453_03750 [Patescibacteria group bacterium]